MQETTPEDRSISATPPSRPQEDHMGLTELVARCLAGEDDAFATLTDQYGGLLLRTAYLLVRDEEEAKDIVQESLLLAWKNLERLREPVYLRAWLLKIVVNQSTSLKRRLARNTTLLREHLLQQYIDSTIHETDFQRGQVEDTLDITQAIGQLPINQRTVLVLFYYHHMSLSEIASMLGVAENTLRKRLQSALEKIRRALRVDHQYTNEAILSQYDTHSPLEVC